MCMHVCVHTPGKQAALPISPTEAQFPHSYNGRKSGPSKILTPLLGGSWEAPWLPVIPLAPVVLGNLLNLHLLSVQTGLAVLEGQAHHLLPGGRK